MPIAHLRTMFRKASSNADWKRLFAHFMLVGAACVANGPSEFVMLRGFFSFMLPRKTKGRSGGCILSWWRVKVGDQVPHFRTVHNQ